MDPLAEYPQTGPPLETYLYHGRAGTLIGMKEQQACTEPCRSGGGAGKEYWFSQDGLGNIATVTKHSGQSAHDYFYDPYGNIIDNNGRPEDSSNWTDPHNHYLLNGKEWDEEMRLHYFGARYYDSAAGVWLTQDIYRGEPRQPMTLHRTLYVLANPVNYVDAYGYNAIRPVPNGYGGVGGGSEPVRTTNPTAPNATHPQNAPYHFESTGRDDLYFNDFHSVDTYAGGAAPAGQTSPLHPDFAHGLVNFGLYGPDPYLELGFYVEEYDFAEKLAWFNRNGDTLSFMGGLRRDPFTGQLLSIQDSMLRDVAELNYLRSLPGCTTDACWDLADQLEERYGWEASGKQFNYQELQNIWDAAQLIEGWFERHGGGDAPGRMRATFGGTSFFHQQQTPLFGIIETSAALEGRWGPHPLIGFAEMKDRSHVLGSSVYLDMNRDDIVETIIHEMGHVLDNRFSNAPWPGAAVLGGGPGDAMAYSLGADPTQCLYRANCESFGGPNWETYLREAEIEINPSLYARRTGPSEDFAETFAYSVLQNEDLADMPQRAAWMSNFARSQLHFGLIPGYPPPSATLTPIPVSPVAVPVRTPLPHPLPGPASTSTPSPSGRISTPIPVQAPLPPR
jgi:RHS repeat-associated protein